MTRQHNEFRAADAIEFVRAMDACEGSQTAARNNLRELSERIGAIEARGEEVPSYLLAAYRGYEAVLAPPMLIVKLDQSPA